MIREVRISKQIVSVGGALLLGLLSASCVSEGKYNDLMETADFYQQGYHDYERYVPSLEADNERLRSELELLQTGAAVPAGFHEDLDGRMVELQALMDRIGAPAGGLSAYPIEGGVGYSLSDTILFASGSTEITDEGRALLARLAGELVERGGTTEIGRIWVRGHTDDVPVLKPESLERFPHGNLQLSAARAIEAAAALLATGEVDPALVVVVGFGPHAPVVPHGDAESRASNRRVELHVIDAGSPGEGP